MTGLTRTPLIQDGDEVTISRTVPEKAVQFFQATRDSNRPEVRKKPIAFYQEHAELGRLLHMERDGHIIAGAYIRRPAYDRFIACEAEESGGLFVHPDAQGWGLGAVMGRESLIARLSWASGEKIPKIVATILQSNSHVARAAEARGFRLNQAFTNDPASFEGGKAMVEAGDALIRGLHYVLHGARSELLDSLISARGAPYTLTSKAGETINIKLELGK